MKFEYVYDTDPYDSEIEIEIVYAIYDDGRSEMVYAERYKVDEEGWLRYV